MKNSTQLAHFVFTTLDENKALDILQLDVRKLTDMTDFMLICSVTSKRQGAAIASKLIEKAKQAKIPVFSTSGETDAEWILIDLYDVIVHVMLPEVRNFYSLEKLWGME